ncbi:hypothetical protein [Sinobacterium caligoides]|nr:hypothetical protein [Sinobacterium caligoides]
MERRVLSHEVTSGLQDDDVLLERIPDAIYDGMVAMFARQYHFNNGEKMRLSNYFVKISRALNDEMVAFIQETIQGLEQQQFPTMPAPDGFQPSPNNLLEAELKGGFTLASFDLAVTDGGMKNIEFQSVATYPISAAKLNQYLLDNLPLDDGYIFSNSPQTDWQSFTRLYGRLLAGENNQRVALVDRKVKGQKTNFEFFATQQELAVPVDIVDMEDIFEDHGELFYTLPPNPTPLKLSRFYNRILLAEALFEDDYPNNSEAWGFRFDKAYQALKFINHPIKQFEVSKRLSPYIQHPCNPDCYELAEVAQHFKEGRLKYQDYVWKHKWGAAGHRLVLAPDAATLTELADCLEDYIAQSKVAFKVFKTDDKQEKIVELRFMTAVENGETIIVPMARIGHVVNNGNGDSTFKIHFSDNNKEGYGFSPVVIMNSE